MIGSKVDLKPGVVFLRYEGFRDSYNDQCEYVRGRPIHDKGTAMEDQEGRMSSNHTQSERRRTWSSSWTSRAILAFAIAGVICFAWYRWRHSWNGPSWHPHQKMEIDQLGMVLQKFNGKFGTFPPDPSWPEVEVREVMLRVFPRISDNDLDDAVERFSRMNHAEALVFWLGGLWDGKKMIGFSANPQDPFRSDGPRNAPRFGFEERRLHDKTGVSGAPEYYGMRDTDGEAAPYVYFAARRNGEYAGKYRHPGAGGTAVPYCTSLDENGRPTFVHPNEFQIIFAGFDNDYGPDRNKVFPTGLNYGPGDEDNMTNFAEDTLYWSQ